jgi:hypothetical protein
MPSKGRKRQRPRPWQDAAPPPLPDPATRRRRECGTKVGHANRVSAEQAALEHEDRYGEVKDVYDCPWCGRWHVGSPR